MLANTVPPRPHKKTTLTKWGEGGFEIQNYCPYFEPFQIELSHMKSCEKRQFLSCLTDFPPSMAWNAKCPSLFQSEFVHLYSQVDLRTFLSWKHTENVLKTHWKQLKTAENATCLIKPGWSPLECVFSAVFSCFQWGVSRFQEKKVKYQCVFRTKKFRPTEWSSKNQITSIIVISV